MSLRTVNTVYMIPGIIGVSAVSGRSATDLPMPVTGSVPDVRPNPRADEERQPSAPVRTPIRLTSSPRMGRLSKPGEPLRKPASADGRTTRRLFTARWPDGIRMRFD